MTCGREGGRRVDATGRRTTDIPRPDFGERLLSGDKATDLSHGGAKDLYARQFNRLDERNSPSEYPLQETHAPPPYLDFV
jgi:hypothetical protein